MRRVRRCTPPCPCARSRVSASRISTVTPSMPRSRSATGRSSPREPLIVGHAGGRGVVRHGLLRRAHVRRPLGHADVPGAGAVPAGNGDPPDMAKYKRVSEEIRAIFAAATSVVEPVSLDEAYLDLTDDDRTEVARRLPRRWRTSRGGSRTRSASRCRSASPATSFWPSSLPSCRSRVASRSSAAPRRKDFLAPLSVRKIHGVGAVTARRMEESGLETIADLQALKERELVARFGKFGHRLALFAHGEDDRRVTPVPAREEHLRRDHVRQGHRARAPGCARWRKTSATGSPPSSRARAWREAVSCSSSRPRISAS